jgi:hypothetical protein
VTGVLTRNRSRAGSRNASLPKASINLDAFNLDAFASHRCFLPPVTQSFNERPVASLIFVPPDGFYRQSGGNGAAGSNPARGPKNGVGQGWSDSFLHAEATTKLRLAVTLRLLRRISARSEVCNEVVRIEASGPRAKCEVRLAEAKIDGQLLCSGAIFENAGGVALNAEGLLSSSVCLLNKSENARNNSRLRVDKNHPEPRSGIAPDDTSDHYESERNRGHDDAS